MYVDAIKNWFDFGDLGIILKVTPALGMSKFCLSAPYILKQKSEWVQIVGKSKQYHDFVLYHWDSQKICLDFGDLDSNIR